MTFPTKWDKSDIVDAVREKGDKLDNAVALYAVRAYRTYQYACGAIAVIRDRRGQ